VKAAPGNDADWLFRSVGYRAKDRALLERALTHRSAAGADNERLEFLGDAVLSFVVADILYRDFADSNEGDLTRYRAALVSGDVLSEVGKAVGIGERMRLGSGELRSGGFRRPSILGDAFEAVLGFIYLDGGIEAVRDVVERLWRERVRAIRESPPEKDPKTRLQEWLQGRSLGLPEYVEESVKGEPHARTFTVLCRVALSGIEARGSGSSRRRAEQIAAEQVLEALAREPTND
jgi:ribonuclease III